MLDDQQTRYYVEDVQLSVGRDNDIIEHYVWMCSYCFVQWGEDHVDGCLVPLALAADAAAQGT